MEHVFFAVVQPGFENAAAAELGMIGISGVRTACTGGLEFSGRMEDCYRVNACSRTVTRLLMRLGRFGSRDPERLYSGAKKIPWELLVGDGTKLKFSCSWKRSRLHFGEKIEKVLFEAISERMAGCGLGVVLDDGSAAAQTIYARIENDVCEVSLDSTGPLLYRRGEKIRVSGAGLRETLAALILHEAGICGYDMIIDPMCGAGTFSIEAIGILLGRFPGTGRTFSFMDWPCFSPAAYANLVGRLARESEGRGGGLIALTGDIDEKSAAAAGRNLADAGLAEHADVRRRDFFRDAYDHPRGKKCLVVLNPPYGKRMRPGDIRGLYRMIGNTIRGKYADCGYAVISPGLEYEKIMSLPYDRKVLFMNGGLKVAAIFRDAK